MRELFNGVGPAQLPFRSRHTESGVDFVTCPFWQHAHRTKEKRPLRKGWHGGHQDLLSEKAPPCPGTGQRQDFPATLC
jgi:hypothetical protein